MIPRTTVDIGTEERKAIERVLDSGQFVKGKECQYLEEEFASYQGLRFGAGVNSGTSALHLSLLALNVKSVSFHSLSYIYGSILLIKLDV